MASTKAELHAALKEDPVAYPATQGYDVLVSYSEKRINGLLNNAWTSHAGSKNLDFGVDGLGEVILGAPNLQFKTSAENAGTGTLTLPIRGYVNKRIFSNVMKYPIPRGKYSFSTSVEVVAMSGDKKEVSSSDKVVHFDDSKTHTYSLILHVPSGQANWKFTDAHPNEKGFDRKVIDKWTTKFYEWIANAEVIKSLDIQVGAVTNDKYTHSDLLQPTAFKFGTQDGALNIFINTKGGFQEGVAEPKFQPGGKDILPFPEDYDASIIISRKLFQDKFLIPQIRKQCDKLMKDDNVGKVYARGMDSGIKLALVFNRNLTVGSGSHRTPSATLVTSDSHGFTIDFNDKPVHLIIEDDSNLKPVYRWEWNYSKSVHWSNTIWTMDGDVRTGGSGDGTATIPKNEQTLGSSDGEKLSITLKFEDKHQPIVGMPRDAPDSLKDVVIKLNTFDFTMDGLDFFASTNVLAPRDGSPGSIKMTDIMLPHDLILMEKKE
ncbi:hypothetical protein PT974_04735 [Cladobotryum mycophilum]|uniref:Uncharacterized protein n=1 Tax=Cladobotryum mycophilum TaxID=491253 RepID=A0ABR0SQ89_9HYPO